MVSLDVDDLNVYRLVKIFRIDLKSDTTINCFKKIQLKYDTCSLIVENESQTWCLTPVMPALRRQRQVGS